MVLWVRTTVFSRLATALKMVEMEGFSKKCRQRMFGTRGSSLGFNARLRKKKKKLKVLAWPEDCGNRTDRSDRRMDTLLVGLSTDQSVGRCSPQGRPVDRSTQRVRTPKLQSYAYPMGWPIVRPTHRYV